MNIEPASPLETAATPSRDELSACAGPRKYDPVGTPPARHDREASYPLIHIIDGLSTYSSSFGRPPFTSFVALYFFANLRFLRYFGSMPLVDLNRKLGIFLMPLAWFLRVALRPVWCFCLTILNTTGVD